MAPTELDKRIRDILEQRRIDPSPGSWEKLSGKLPAKRPSRPGMIKKYGIAAVLAGLLFLGTFLVRRHPEKLPAVTATDVPAKGAKASIPGETATLTSHDEEVKIPKEKTDNVVSNGVSAADSNPNALQVQFAAGLVEEERFPAEKTIHLQPTDAPGTDDLIDEKAVEVAARVAEMEASEGEVTAAEVEALLRAAQAEIVRNSQPPDLESIDPMVLLSEVEANLDKSFRDQIFEKLKTGYERVRTAVADRNN